MKIAILACGSQINGTTLQLDGPLLPVEFTWNVPQRRLLLVFCDEPWVLNVRTPWVMSTLDDFQRTKQDLAERENVPEGEIGYLKLRINDTHDHRLTSLHDANRQNEVLGRLSHWGLDHQVDAVIWRDTHASILQGQGPDDARNQVIAHLQGLQGDAAAAAATYVRRVPVQVWTIIRAAIAVQLGWVPGPADAAITTADDQRFKDWQECRTTIGRLDTILEDLRKVGFSLITGLLTAGDFLNLLGVGEHVPLSHVRAAVFITVMVLVATLFSVDTYYQVLLSGANERALDLEAQTIPWIRVTKYLSVNATRSGISFVILALYLVLLVTAGGLGLLAVGGLNLAPPWPLGTWFWTGLAGLVVGLIVVILARWVSKPKPGRLPMIAGVLLPGFTVGLGTFLWQQGSSSAAADPLGVRYWILGAGMFLAIYIQLYWVYSAWRAGLYRQKPSRNWPEGIEKVAQ
jgi:hypothetical protein